MAIDTNNKFFRKAKIQYQKTSNFLKKRFKRDEFWGLTLTILVVAFLYILFLFSGIIEDLINQDAIVLADTRIENLLYAFRSPKYIHLFLWITAWGIWPIVSSLVVVLLIIFLILKRKDYIIALLVTVLGAWWFEALAKIIFSRPRPDVAWYLEKSYSFPSGHGVIAVAFYGFLAYILWRLVKSWKAKAGVLIFFILFILAIGFSRIYLGVHFLSDVAGGYLLGALWLILGIGIIKWFDFKNLDKQKKEISSKHKKIIIGLIIMELVFCFAFAFSFNPTPLNVNLLKKESVNNPLALFNDYNLPRYTETLVGTNQEPISFIIVASSSKSLIDDFQKAGWFSADRINLISLTKFFQAAFWHRGYNQAPMSPSFWNSQVNSFGFEEPLSSSSVYERHHARFWQTGFSTDGSWIYVGTASLDDGLKWYLISHRISPNIDAERDYVFSSLLKAGVVSQYQKIQFTQPEIGYNFVGDKFFTDGQAYLIYLK